MTFTTTETSDKVIIRALQKYVDELEKQNEALKSKCFHLVNIIDDYNEHEADFQLRKVKEILKEE